MSPLSLAFSCLTALCLVVFLPLTENTNLIKELLWWTGVICLTSLGFLAADQKAILQWRDHESRTLKRFLPSWILLIFWMVWAFIGSLRSPDMNPAFLSMERLAGSAITFLIFHYVFRQTSAIQQFLRINAAACGLIALYTLAQFAGFDFFQWNDARRASGTFGNPNFTAECLAAFLPLVFIWEIRKRSLVSTTPPSSVLSKPTTRSPQSHNPLSRIRDFPFLSLLIVAAILATQSRAGLVALAAGILGLTYLLHKSLRKVLLVSLTGIAAVVILFTALWWIAPLKMEHLLSSNTIALRIELWKGSLSLWSEKPLTGWGAGAFRIAEEKIKYRLEPIAGDRYAIHAHSWLIELLVEQGIIGALLFTSMMAAFLFRIVQFTRAHPQTPESRIAAGIASGIFALLSGTLFCVFLNRWDGVWILWSLLGLGVGISTSLPSLPSPPSISSISTIPSIPSVPISPQPELDQAATRRRISYNPLGIFPLICCPIVVYFLGSFGYSEILRFQAKRTLDHGQWRETLELLGKAKHQLFHSPQVEFQEAEAWFKGQNFEAAKTAWESYVAKSTVPPDELFNWSMIHSDSWVFLGCVENELGRPRESREAFEKAFSQEPSGDKAIVLARYYLSVHENDRARELMRSQLRKAVYPELLSLYLQTELQQGRIQDIPRFIEELHTLPLSAASRKRLQELEDRIQSSSTRELRKSHE